MNGNIIKDFGDWAENRWQQLRGGARMHNSVEHKKPAKSLRLRDIAGAIDESSELRIRRGRFINQEV